jgi:hypothetical protein
MQEGKTKSEANVIVLVPGNTFTMNFILCWTKTVCYFFNSNISFFYKFFYSPIVSHVRNLLLGSDLNKIELSNPIALTPFNDALSVDKVIFIDSDMVWEPEELHKLIMSPFDITVAPYILSDKKTVSVARTKNFMTIEEIKQCSEPFLIEHAGFGFVSCNLEVLKKMGYPWFSVQEYINNSEGKKTGHLIGEDVFFFKKAQEMGFSAYCDPRIKVGHEKVTTLTI